MESNLAKKSREMLIKEARKMTLAERLAAFYEHSRLLVQFRESTRRARKRRTRRSA